MKKKTHRLRFWGVRGSIPTSDPYQDNFGGNTSCVEITSADGTLIILDSGTGIRKHGNDIARKHDSAYDIHLFLSHTHWDHIIGFPFFAPIHQPHAHITIYGPKRANDSLEHTIYGLFQAPYFPLVSSDIKAKLTFVELDEGQLRFSQDNTVHFAPHPHPNGALTYRLDIGGQVITYVTDIEHTKERLVPSVVELSRNADILIHDCHFNEDDLPTHRAWGHSSWEECVQVALKAKVKQLFLYHFSPNYSDNDILDMERLARAKFPKTAAAHQSMTLEIPAT
ncbi:MAG: MBL fold metallo-hydrolase [Candidatus Marinimicrobia bacterium]|nr:MBL fold metallo-hydrolase [Candidatus Neomarinimicrobiota bacterium]